MDWQEVHAVNDRQRLIVEYDYTATLSELLGEDIGIQNLTNRIEPVNTIEELSTDDSHRETIAAILNWHGGYFSNGSEAMTAAVEKHFQRAGLFFSLFLVHAHAQGTQRYLVAYSEDPISDSTRAIIQDWYAGNIFSLTLQTRPETCACGCLGDWEFTDSLGCVSDLDPTDRQAAIDLWQELAYSLQEVTA